MPSPNRLLFPERSGNLHMFLATTINRNRKRSIWEVGKGRHLLRINWILLTILKWEFFVFFFCLFFWDISLCSEALNSGWLWTHDVAQADLEFTQTFLPQPPRNWDYTYMPPRNDSCSLLVMFNFLSFRVTMAADMSGTNFFKYLLQCISLHSYFYWQCMKNFHDLNNVNPLCLN